MRHFAYTLCTILLFATQALAQDLDSDGILDSLDNCIEAYNPEQTDEDSDGYGNRCDPDHTNDGVVGGPDYTTFSACFSECQDDDEGAACLACDDYADYTGDTLMGGPDFIIFKDYFIGVTNDGNPGPAAMPTGCDCGSTNATTPCTGNSVSTVKDNVNFELNFTCNGKAARCGQFADESYWIAAIDRDGAACTNIVITSSTPSGTDNGMQLDPSNGSHGLLPGNDGYASNLNLMTQLPYNLDPDPTNSIIKVKTVKDNSGADCRPKSNPSWDCAVASEVYTFVETVPANAGSTLVRPPFVGTTKPLHAVTDFDFDLLPEMPAISGHASQEAFTTIRDRWENPIWDFCGFGTCGGQGNGYRAFFPEDDFAGTASYGANAARSLQNDMASLFGDEPMEDEKLAATLAILARGSDLYHTWALGGSWQAGAGQKMSRKQPVVFYAALIGGATATTVAAIPSTDPFDFHEDGQIHEGNGVVTWGTGPTSASGGSTSCTELKYWSSYVSYKRNGTNQKLTCADPYNWVDGPAENPGTSYMAVTAGPFNGWGFLQYLMPALKNTNNQPKSLVYADRIKQYANNPPGGVVWAEPDGCAGVDDREDLNACGSIGQGGNAGCVYFKVTWGPDDANPGECIGLAAGGANTDVRYPTKHGNTITISNQSPIIQALWPTLRPTAPTCGNPGQEGLCGP